MVLENFKNISIVGATGIVGTEIIKILAEREFPVSQVKALASKDSIGKEISYGLSRTLMVQDLDSHDFSRDDLSFFVAGSGVSHNLARKVALTGCIIIDNSSHFRSDDEVPLIIPEVNPHAIKQYKKTNIIANPNCSTVQMLVPLKPLHDFAKIRKIIVSTYQSTSGAGRAAMDELYEHTKEKFAFSSTKAKNFLRPIPFNCIPQIDEINSETGFSVEENKMILETKKILEDDTIEVYPTCVRVPVFVGHAESVTVEFKDEISVDDVYDLLNEVEGIILSRDDYRTQIEVVGYDDIFVSRVRQNSPNTISMWIVTDNIRKGAALNAVQIAELLQEFL